MSFGPIASHDCQYTHIPVGYVDPELDGGLEEDLNSRRYRAMLPEDEYDSEEY